MHIRDLFKQKKFTLSFEVFPPTREGNLENLFVTIKELSDLKPDFISVTYGAGGSTREKTLEIASRVKKDFNTEALAHLTCVQSTKDDIARILDLFKDENIENNVVNESEKDIIKEPYDLTKVSVAIAIDGIQTLPTTSDGEYDLDPLKKPVQQALQPDELRQAEDIVKAAVGYSEGRGDQVSVKNIMFDRSRDWKGLRDEYRRKEQIKRMMLAGLVGVFALFLGFILFGAIKREINRRRRIREEQLALEQQRMREAALRAAEDEGVEVELSLEEKARRELQDNAMTLAKERPDDVAQLLRTWLAEE